ncbi:hypothetical protein ACQPXB_02075 [Amycolatopsis sp. CA-161197]|uniref:hypothetical protein n=1 Tax=unclassified Amycolatopsis TaxID=2618356 RepID=UPI0034511613
MSNTVNILIGLVVLAWLCWRQTQKRLVREDRKPTVLLILAVLGVVSLASFFKGTTPGTPAVLLLIGSLVVAALFGLVRAYTVRLWRADSQLWRQGTWLTVVLWVVAIAVHIGLDFVIDANSPAKGLGSASILLYLAVSLGAQRLVVQSRANHVVAV